MGGKPGRAAAHARVVIVGCGFGGLFCARALKNAPVQLTVVDRNNSVSYTHLTLPTNREV